MRLAQVLLSLLLAACAPEASTVSPDGGAGADAGSSCDAGVGPLDSCIAPKGPCDECATAGDCSDGAACVDFSGCRLCALTRGEARCAVRACVVGGECCDGTCVQLDDPPMCGGAPMPAPDECDEARLCPDGYQCETVDVRCSASGPGRVCRPTCPGTPCGAGETCDDTRCRPSRCDDPVPFSCGALRVCDPSGGDVHGCARRPCSAHADCPGGLCAAGRCLAGLGTCELPRP
jgi:hypothetical protein